MTKEGEDFRRYPNQLDDTCGLQALGLEPRSPACNAMKHLLSRHLVAGAGIAPT